MWQWKRKVGESVVFGDSYLVKVVEVRPADGTVFQGAVVLGFDLPSGTIAQRAETYVPRVVTPFPTFYRYCERSSRDVMGYTFDLPSEAGKLESSYYFEPITQYSDIEPDRDRQLVIHLYRSEAEADACIHGLETTEVVGVDLGYVKAKRDHRWAVLIDLYAPVGYKDDPNPLIRTFSEADERVTRLLNERQEGRTA